MMHQPCCGFIHHKDPGSLQDSSCHTEQLLLSERGSAFLDVLVRIIRSYPVEKLSPPSETGESKSLNTFTFSSSFSTTGTSSDGMRWTLRRASNWKNVQSDEIPDKKIWSRTISASSYSLNTSNVERRVPLRIVGSSAWIFSMIFCWYQAKNLRGIIVNLLLRSVNPIFVISIPSTMIRPSVGSTKRNKERARVLLPLPKGINQVGLQRRKVTSRTHLYVQ